MLEMINMTQGCIVMSRLYKAQFLLPTDRKYMRHVAVADAVPLI